MSRTASQLLGLTMVAAMSAACGQQQANQPAQTQPTAQLVTAEASQVPPTPQPSYTSASQAQVSPLPSPASPTASSAANYRKIESFSTAASLQGQEAQEQMRDGKLGMQFGVYVITTQFEKDKVNYAFGNDLLPADLSQEVIALVEWGVSPSSDIRVDVVDARVSFSQVDLIVTTEKTAPPAASAQVFSSAYAAVAIPRSALAMGGYITFNLIYDGRVVASDRWPQTKLLTFTAANPTAGYRKVALVDAYGSLQSKEIREQTNSGQILTRFDLHALSTWQEIEDVTGQHVGKDLQDELTRDVFVLAEWGPHPSSGFQIDVLDAHISPSQVDLIIAAGATDPSLSSAAVIMSVSTAIVIPRSALDLTKPITFNLIHDGQVVATRMWTLPSSAINSSSSSAYRKISSFASSRSMQSEAVQEQTRSETVPPQYNLYVVSTQQEMDAMDRHFATKLLPGNLDRELIVLAEWGLYRSADVKMDVFDVQVASNKVDIWITLGRADPSLKHEAIASSAYTAIAIPRSALDLTKPITFNLTHGYQIVVTKTWSRP